MIERKETVQEDDGRKQYSSGGERETHGKVVHSGGGLRSSAHCT